MDSVSGPSADHLNAPYAQRWELLKDVMTRLYMDERKKYKEIVKIMESEYQFYASESQYKRRFGIWKLKRALPTMKKDKICKTLVTRAQQEKSSMVMHNGKVEVQKIRRHLKEQVRREKSMLWSIGNEATDIESLSGHALQCGNRIFMNWSIPAAVLQSLKSKAANHTSPPPTDITTSLHYTTSDHKTVSNASGGTPMSGVVVATPIPNSGPSPRNPPSPSNAMSPNSERSAITVAVQESLKIKRAHLFVQKHHPDLLRGMTMQEQYITTEWMHQFWQFSFTSARTWGRGPQIWDSSSLRFDQFPKQTPRSLPGTPATNIESPRQHFGEGYRPEKSSETFKIQRPTDLCRWSIHVRSISYHGIHSPDSENGPVDLDNEDTWRPWATSRTLHDFAESLQTNLESNNFSTIEVNQLPISSSQIAIAAKRSPEQLLQEAFGFSIMARNRNLIDDMLDHIDAADNFTLNDLFPLHLASSYLDGSKTCCLIFNDIVYGMATGEASVRKLYTNHLNHTVLDNLMIAILKAHSSCAPVLVDKAFEKEPRFAGEEVDICGRWDADSDCIRQLQAHGSPAIPIMWKHVFCHTSAQAITHCIGILFKPHWAPNIDTPSGLFLKRCQNEACGLKLQLGPLHALVVTAVYLARLGRDGETLFGMIACLLCLLQNGADPLLKAHISPEALLSNNDSSECTHSELDPLELAQKVPEGFISKWPQERIIGWRVFCAVLGLSQREWRPPVINEPETNEPGGGFRSIYGIFTRDIDENSPSTSFPFMGADSAENRDADMDGDEYSDDSEGDENLDDIKKLCAHRYHYRENKCFGKNRYLATLWAAVQTELLTYRRLNVDDPWISANFDMKSVLESLETGTDLKINLVSKKMMKPFCGCGVFREAGNCAWADVEEASAYYFSNLEDWNRSTLIIL